MVSSSKSITVDAQLSGWLPGSWDSMHLDVWCTNTPMRKTMRMASAPILESSASVGEAVTAAAANLLGPSPVKQAVDLENAYCSG